MDKERICYNKVWYESKKRAKASAKQLENKGYKLIPYRCKVCGYHHLTKKRTIAYKVSARNNA